MITARVPITCMLLRGPGAKTTRHIFAEQMSVQLRAHRKSLRRRERLLDPPPHRRYTRRQWALVPTRVKRSLLGLSHSATVPPILLG